MPQIKPPQVKTKEEAYNHIMVMQSEQIVEAGKVRILREMAEFYADCNSDGGKLAHRALELTGTSE